MLSIYAQHFHFSEFGANDDNPVENLKQKKRQKKKMMKNCQNSVTLHGMLSCNNGKEANKLELKV